MRDKSPQEIKNLKELENKEYSLIKARMGQAKLMLHMELKLENESKKGSQAN